jgi:hypothetical protein
MNSHVVDSVTNHIQVETCKNLAAQAMNDFQFKSDSIQPLVNVITGNSVNHSYFKQRSQDPKTILSKALTLVFPPRFLDNLMHEQLIDVNTANKWLLEYRKYLVMAYLSDQMISPSEQVDQVWHLHMTYTQHYRATCDTLVEREFKHAPSSGGSSEGDKFKSIYADTLSFYRAIFLLDAPSDVWEPIDTRFDNKNFEFRNINLYRLAVVFSMKTINPNFLYPATPGVPCIPTKSASDMKSLPPSQKKFIVRRNKRNKFKNQKENYGWRNNYHDPYYHGYYVDYSYSSRSSRIGHRSRSGSHDGHRGKNEEHKGQHSKDNRTCRNEEYDYYGPPYMVGGGLIIISNPSDENYINSSNIGDDIHHGFYDDMGDNYNDMDIDDIAD